MRECPPGTLSLSLDRHPTRDRLSLIYGGVEDRVQRILVDRRCWLIETASCRIPLSDFSLGAPRRRDYAPSSWSSLNRILPRREVRPDDIFLDVGCGLGRIVLAAAVRYPFKRVIGVDVVPDFTDAVRKAVDLNQHRLRCKKVEVVTADATTWAVPEDVTVAYLFDPVHAKRSTS